MRAVMRQKGYLMMTGVLPAPTIKGDTALYSEVSPGVDVSVQARRSGWEQLTILKDAAAVEAAVKAPLEAWIAQAKAYLAATAALQTARGE